MPAPGNLGGEGAKDPGLLGLVRAVLMVEYGQTGLQGTGGSREPGSQISRVQMVNTCPEVLDRDKEGRRLGEEEEEQEDARPEFPEEGRGRITPGQQREMAKAATLATPRD